MSNNHTWPQLPYIDFKSTAYLLHRGLQAIGKLKLNTSYEPHWSNVALWLTCRGLTTGPISYKEGIFSVEIDLVMHRIEIITSEGLAKSFPLVSMSVSQFTENLLSCLEQLNIHLKINNMPQEVENPIAFDKDIQQQHYDKQLANRWWKILLKSYVVMQRYHSLFAGYSPPIGLMWGTFDLRDARYNGVSVPTKGINSDYIRRNAMNEAQVEIGWWPGNENYPRPAYFSFIYPAPKGIEEVTIKPKKAHWDARLGEFILDYEDLTSSTNPEKDLFDFFQSSYKASTELAHWRANLVTKGRPN